MLVRILTALGLFAVVVPFALMAPAQWFIQAVSLVLALTLLEWLRLLSLGRGPCLAVSVAFFTMTSLLLHNVYFDFYALAPVVLFIACLGWIAALYFALVRSQVLGGAMAAIWAFFACFATWFAVWVAREQGLTVLLLAVVLVWIADSGAYFAGKWFGRMRLAPSISPGKTWEGVLGAVLLNMVVLVGLTSWLPYGWNWATVYRWGYPVLAMAVLAFTLLSVAGDLFQSLLKRRAGVKDSGNLLPGHGGLYDRLDAALVVLPFTVLTQLWAESRL
ncbi:MAG: phosphatidate cytidylyltransferase [Burkholderiaceae bacterium]